MHFLSLWGRCSGAFLRGKGELQRHWTSPERLVESYLWGLPFQHQWKVLPALCGPGPHACALARDPAIRTPTGPEAVRCRSPGDGQLGGPNQGQS